jgi:ATP-dependent helicase/nuclease subunit A
MWTAADLVEYLGQLVNLEETYDGIPARPMPQAPVRLMNLHKAKGLEASVVFLADPAGESDHPLRLHVDRSGAKVCGYMAMYGEAVGRGKPPLLAHPPTWEQLAGEESKFEDAENQRLKYVAVTRAGAALIVSQRTKGNDNNPWGCFEADLTECEELSDPGPVNAPPAESVTFTRQQVEAGSTQISQRWHTITSETYAVAAAKQLAIRGKVVGALGQEHGTEWGTVIHALLQAAMRTPGADLRPLAASALAEVELPTDLAEEAVRSIQEVMRSELWKRAMASPRKLVEVPFQTLQQPDAGDGSPVPVVLRGVIDLVFWEDDGWVVVDYKTDAAGVKDTGKLRDHYRPQVRLYAAAWQRATGERVKEVGLYFLRPGEYVIC